MGGEKMTQEQLKIIAYLNQAFYLDKNITALIAAHESNISLTQRCTASYENSGAGRTTNNENNQENAIHKLIDLSDKINKEIDKLVDARNKIADIISKIDNPESKAILTRRYLLYQSIQDIADIMHYSGKTIQRKHKHAIDNITPFIAMENNVVLECRP